MSCESWVQWKTSRPQDLQVRRVQRGRASVVGLLAELYRLDFEHAFQLGRVAENPLERILGCITRREELDHLVDNAARNAVEDQDSSSSRRSCSASASQASFSSSGWLLV